MAEQKQLKFDLGFVGMTQGVAGFIEEAEGRNEKVIALLARHQSGDWGEVPVSDKIANDRAVDGEGRLVSRYTVDGESLYIITEWDRSITTVQQVSEY